MNSRFSRSLRSYASRASSFPVPSSYRTPVSIAVAVAAAVALSLPSHAADKTWTGATDGDWNTTTNWTGGSPGAVDVAVFNSAFTNQPSLSAGTATGAVWATTGLAQDITIGGANTLSLGGATVNGQSNTVIMLDVNRNLTFTAPLSLTAGRFITNNSTGTITLAADNASITGGGALTVNGNNASGVVALGNTGTLNKQLTINTSGTVKLGGTMGNTLTLTGGVLDIGSGLASNFITTANAGSTITTSTVGTSTLSYGSNSVKTLNGTIQDGGVGKLLAISLGGGNNIITGNNTYSGGTTVNGTVALGSDTALGTGGLSLASNSIVRSTSDDARALANDVTVAGTVTFGSVTAGQTGNLSFGTLTKSSSNTFTVNNAQTSFTGILGVGTITKTGAGALVIGNGAASTFTGNFTVSAGTLLINGDTSSMNGASTVAAGATVGGTGTLGGNWAVTGNLSPGTSPGTLAVEGNLAINNGANYLFEGGDLVTVGSILDLNENWTLTLGGGLTDGGSVTIFTFGSLASSPDLLPTFDITNLGFSPSSELTLTQVGNTIVLNGVSVALVPEPSAIVLAAVGAGWLVWGRRRKFA